MDPRIQHYGGITASGEVGKIALCESIVVLDAPEDDEKLFLPAFE